MGLDPAKPFYIASTLVRSDDTIDWENPEGVEGTFATEAEAIEHLKGLIDEFQALTAYVYLATPVVKVGRGRIKVTRLP